MNLQNSCNSWDPFINTQALADSDFVVEAIREDEAVKKTAFSLLDHVGVFLRTIVQGRMSVTSVGLCQYPSCTLP